MSLTNLADILVVEKNFFNVTDSVMDSIWLDVTKNIHALCVHTLFYVNKTKYLMAIDTT